MTCVYLLLILIAVGIFIPVSRREKIFDTVSKNGIEISSVVGWFLLTLFFLLVMLVVFLI